MIFDNVICFSSYKLLLSNDLLDLWKEDCATELIGEAKFEIWTVIGYNNRNAGAIE